MKFYTWLLSLIASFSVELLAVNYTPPEKLENQNPSRASSDYSKSRKEGWSLISYFVDENGRANQIEVIGRSQVLDVDALAIRYLSNLRFKAATFEGKAIRSAKEMVFSTNKSFYGRTNDGITSVFSGEYEKADELIRQGRLDLAEQSLNTLRSHAENLTEQALTSWIDSKYFAQRENWLAYANAIQTADLLRDVLPDKLAVKNTQNKLYWHLYNEAYSDAHAALCQLRDISGGGLSESNFNSVSSDIKNKVADKLINEKRVKLGDNLYWRYQLARSTISIELLNGEINFAEARCDNGHKSFNTFPQSQIVLPPDFLKCTLYIKGSKGTEVKFTEQGELRKI